MAANFLNQLLSGGGTPQRPAMYPREDNPEDQFALMDQANWFNPMAEGYDGGSLPVATQFDPMATDSRLGNAATVEKEKNALNTLFQGAIFSGDLDKASQLAVTPEHQALLSVAYGQRMNRQAGGQGNLMADYQNAQNTNLARSRMEEDRRLKMRQMNDASAKTQAETTNLVLKPMEPRPLNVAPSLTEVVDPTDSSRLLRVDARTYKGGGLGSPGVFGASGKEPTAAKREETANNGRDGLAADLQLMRDAYDKLDAAKAIPSTANNSLTNIKAKLQSSGVGQAVGGAIGTEEQAARNEIQATKRRLLSSIKNITGASAQEMNSNVELKTWMDSLGDPKGIVESNRGILDAIESKYIRAKDYKNPAPANATQSNIPNSAIQYLRANPAMKTAFDMKYGQGSAARVMGQ